DYLFTDFIPRGAASKLCVGRDRRGIFWALVCSRRMLFREVRERGLVFIVRILSCFEINF
ncbi:hypothetical protein, partial [Candidatus Ichthyocystis sparus]|uniref:hypothetical protein n=1 Tax=Candidatus Ichthyocystis sparus TaxID=1561004 RepID=UPI00159ED284